MRFAVKGFLLPILERMIDMSEHRKIAVIGAGHVGSHCAQALCWRWCAQEIVLIDKEKEKAIAQAMDIADSLSFPAADITVRAGDYADCADADLIFVAIGKARLPGQTRLDLLGDSVKMAKELIGQLSPYSLRGIVVSITNPADIIADYLRKGLHLPRNQVFSTGTLLDTARLIRTIAEKTGMSRQAVTAFSLGEHGDSSMIPFSAIRIGGLPLEAYPMVNRAELLERTHGIGMDIINGKGSTEFGIGQSAAFLADAILRDRKAVLPVSVQLCGEYGQKDVSCGVPCVIGKSGVEKIIELPLTPDEQEQLQASCDVIRKHIALAEQIAPLD